MKKSVLTTLASAVLLAILSTFTAVPAHAATRVIDCSNGGTFTIVGTKVTSQNSCQGNVTVPADVTEIGQSALENCRFQITGVSFEPGSQLTTLGAWSIGCLNASSITLPIGLKVISDQALGHSRITSISIPGTVQSFIGQPFLESQLLENVVFEPTTAATLSINSAAFRYNGGLKSVTFKGPTKWNGELGIVQKADNNFLGWSTSLGGPIVASPVTGFGSGDVTIYTNFAPKVITDTPCPLGGTFKTIDNVIHESTPDCAGAITVPANVTKIDFTAFAGRAITQVNFEPGSHLTTIGTWAFDRTKLTSIAFPSSVTTIEGGAFARIPSLTSVTIPSTVLNVGGGAFSESGLENLVIEPRTVPGGSIARDVLDYTRLLRSVTFKGPFQLSSEPTHELYANDFLGWSTTPNGPIVSVPLSVAASDSLTLYPHSSPRTYNANYDSKGGSSVASGLIIGGDIQFPTPPTRTGYDFAGWFQYPWDVDPITRWDFNYDAYLSARWTPKTYTVDLISNGGSSVPPASFVTDGAIASEPTPPVRRGYVFDGWAATQAGDALTYPYYPGVLEGISLFARWIPDHVVSFDSKGGSAVPFDYFSTGGQIDGVPLVPTRAGYTLLGWSATDGGDVVDFPYIPGVTVDITLYAKWSADSHVVTLNSKSGSAVAPVSFVTDGEVSLTPPTPVRPGYTFHGWAATDGGTAVSFPYTPGVIGDITFYATWTRDPYKAEKLSDATVAGTGIQSTVMTATTGSWDAFPEAAVSLQWYRCDKAVDVGLSALPSGSKCVKINGSTEPDYKVVVADAGKFLTVLVQAQNNIGTTVTTGQSFFAPKLLAPTKVQFPVVTGTAVAKKVLTASAGTWNSNPVAVTTFQWFRCEKATKASKAPVAASSVCTAIKGATKATYKLLAADEGMFVTSQVTAVNTQGTVVVTASSPHVALTPSNTSVPLLSGTAMVGKGVTANTGAWLGFPTPKTTVQWYRCAKETTSGEKKFKGSTRCVAIAGANKKRYTLSAADQNKYISALVSATNAAATVTITVASQQVAFKPTKAGNPKISGSAALDKTLTASPGRWKAFPEATTSFKWYRCTNPTVAGAEKFTGSGCVPIGGATDSKYTVTAADQGKYIAVLVKAVNSAGSTSATSKSTGKVG